MIVLRWLAALLVLIVGLVGLSFLQKKFDEGDLQKALGVVRLKVPGTQNCRGEILSRVRGRARVVCEEGSWIVDVVRGTIEKETP